MEFFRKNNGSITVFVTLILVPTIFFEGFMVDLARVKLYGNQAVMAADNYGEAVISMYDNLLKDLYGLFAVTQDEEAIKELDNLNAYIKASFNPSENMIDWQHLTEVRKLAGLNNTYDGFMPYKQAEVTLSYDKIQNSTLTNADILGTQIGDFMKFRIALSLFESDDTILEAIDAINKAEKDTEAIQKQNELSKQVDKVMEAVQEYYKTLKKIYHYAEYTKNINVAYANACSGINTIANSSSYKIYKDYKENEEEITQAVGRKNALKDGEELSDSDKELVEKYDAYQNDSEAREDKLQAKFNDEIGAFEESLDDDVIDFDSFEETVNKLKEQASDLQIKLIDLQNIRASLQSTLDSNETSQAVKDGMKEELESLDKLFEEGGTYSAQNYIGLAEYVAQNIGCNSGYKQQSAAMKSGMEKVVSAYMEFADTIPSWESALDRSLYKNFMDIASYRSLYNSLEETFGNEDKQAAKTAKQKKKDAEKKQKEAKENFEKSKEEDSKTSARDIPESFGFGVNKKEESFALSNMIENAASIIKSNNLAEAGNKILNKVYTSAYDFGMFSSRVTNVKNEDKKSLTGYQMAANINYLYQAELEYILGGHNKASDNLNGARNKIVAFRSIVNYAATYSIKEINNLIRSISTSANGVLPGLGLVVSGALRLAVSGIETVGDWNELKSGESVVVIKQKLEDLTSYDMFKDLIGGEDIASSGSSPSSKKLALNYEQYLLIMIIFMTTNNQLLERTGNLITLNVNAVQSKVGDTGVLSSLKFKLSDAYTAVDATCAIHLDFAVMPKGFAKQVADSDTYSGIESFEKNTYKFTVTRGY